MNGKFISQEFLLKAACIGSSRIVFFFFCLSFVSLIFTAKSYKSHITCSKNACLPLPKSYLTGVFPNLLVEGEHLALILVANSLFLACNVDSFHLLRKHLKTTRMFSNWAKVFKLELNYSRAWDHFYYFFEIVMKCEPDHHGFDWFFIVDSSRLILYYRINTLMNACKQIIVINHI